MKKQTIGFMGIAAITAVSILAAAVFLKGVPEADATGASFNGITNIIENAKSTPFTIVELVPDEKMAKIGYAIEGCEPENWKEELAKLNTKAGRKTYMDNLKSKLNLISAEDNTKPLTYTEYSEKYSLDDLAEGEESKYSSYDLKEAEKFDKEATGYKMVEETGGSFNLELTYTEAEDGDYKENVVSYQFAQDADGKYAVKFKKDETMDFSSGIFYKATEMNKVTSVAEAKAFANTRYIYKSDKNATGAALKYEFAFSNKDASDENFDNEKYDYSILKFEPVKTEELTEEDKKNNSYYVVESKDYVKNEGEYTGLLNEKEPYVKVSEGEKGNFKRNEGDSYIFVGKGMGNMKLVEDADGKLDHPLEIKKIFYTGGYKNNNWFENGVFLKTFDKSTAKGGMQFDVITLTPGAINSKKADFFKNIGLLYISASSSLISNKGELKSYAADNDINKATFDAIKNELSSSNLPILLENNKSGIYNNAPQIKDLIELLLQGKDSTYKDGHFVNKSIYVINSDEDGKIPTIFESFATDFIKKSSDDSSFTKEADEKGFKEVAESIVEENSIVEKGIAGITDNTEKFKLEISKARVLEYIISYNLKRKKTTDNLIKILDIEPAKVVGSTTPKKRMEDKVKTWFPGRTIRIAEPDVVPTTEFIGRTEDLSDYDVIYIGLDTSNLNTDVSGKTVYNDTTMNGLIYSNVGDKTFAKTDKWFDGEPASYNSKAGILDTDYKTTNHLINRNKKYKNYEAYKDPENSKDLIKINYNKDSTDKPDNFYKLSWITTKDHDIRDLNADEYLTYRFSGNDITQEKLERLKEYIEAGFPIVFAQGFFKNDKVDDAHIDNCSKMYELAEFALDFRKKGENKNKKNIIFEDARGLENNGANNLADNINLPKPSIELEKPKYEKDADEKLSEYTSIKGNNLEINFKLLNKGFEGKNAKFKLSLFIDNNADGKFSGSTELISEKSYTMVRGNKKQNVSELGASNSEWYKLSYRLPNGYVGVIPWKIKIEQVGTTIGRYTTEKGFGYMKKGENASKPEVNILQIMSDGYFTKYKYNSHFVPRKKDIVDRVKDQGTFGWDTVNNFNMQENRQFDKLVNKVSDFTINVKAITAKEYAKKYLEFTSNPEYQRENKRPEDYFEENGYNMIVLGFSDCYAIPNENNCLEAIQGFINSGKPVLFTHDCSSFINYRGASPWGYDFNRIIRNQVGLDRYGILDNWGIRVGMNSEKGDDKEIFTRHKYPTVSKNSDHDVKSNELFDIIETKAKAQKKDIAYIPKSGKLKIAKEAQGLTYGTLLRSSYVSTDGSRGRYNPAWTKKQLFTYKEQNNGTWTTTVIDQINKGQITTYPFKIKPRVKVQHTHYQSYQLDMNEDADEDGESDIIVWYTLGYDRVRANPVERHGNWYDVSPKDVRNNYYIYTKGNITYSGVGHMKIEDEEEMKLYINTLVAAYRTAMQPPSVTFKETKDADSAEKTISYVSYDVKADKTASRLGTEDKVKIYFVPEDHNDLIKNIVPDKTRILIRYFAGTGRKEYETFKADGTKITEKVKDNKKNEYYVLEKGKMYYFEVPLSELPDNKNKLTIKVVVKTRFTKENKDTRPGVKERYDFSPEGSLTYNIQKRGLFDLD